MEDMNKALSPNWPEKCYSLETNALDFNSSQKKSIVKLAIYASAKEKGQILIFGWVYSYTGQPGLNCKGCFVKLLAMGNLYIPWKDPWIPNVPGFKPTPPNLSNAPFLVSELIGKGTTSWKSDRCSRSMVFS